MNQPPYWSLNHLSDDEERDHQLQFTIELHPDYLDGDEPTVENWFRVLIATSLWVLNNEDFEDDDVIEVEQW